MSETISVIIPAHNEESTIPCVVDACLEAAYQFDPAAQVTVVADHCADRTAQLAEHAGATVLERWDDNPSKAQAVQLGVAATDGAIITLFDADCVGVTAYHVTQLIEPVVRNRAVQTVGVVDYVGLAGLVQRFPWSSGQRALRREIFNWDDSRLADYRLEVLINECVGKQRGLTESVVLNGMTHRSKVSKVGLARGIRADLAMWKSISDLVMIDCDYSNMARYLDGVVVVSESDSRRVSRAEARLGFIVLRSLCSFFARIPDHWVAPKRPTDGRPAN